jgi:hypothetical protein
MSIQQLTVQQKRLSSAEAELWVVVRVEAIEESTTLRGCLVGPICPGVETVQINYPIKPIKPEGTERNVLVGRVLIPEPNFWTPEQPFAYVGHVEWWQGGKCLETRALRAVFKARAERNQPTD